MKERPILFSTPMVQAILDGRKTVTRRIVGARIEHECEGNEPCCFSVYDKHGRQYYDEQEQQPLTLADIPKFNRYGQPGDILWVRETWGKYVVPDCVGGVSTRYLYKADYPDGRPGMIWKPSIHMPKDACRLKLEILSIRVERLHDITEEECFREGIDADNEDYQAAEHYQIGGSPIQGGSPAKFAFIALWQRINGQESWDSNPWVWRIEFKKL